MISLINQLLRTAKQRCKEGEMKKYVKMWISQEIGEAVIFLKLFVIEVL